MRIPVRPTTLAMLFCCLAAPALAKGQFGARAGVNLSKFAGEFGDIVEPENRVAPNLALVYELPLASKLSFHGELGWSGKGGKKEVEGTDEIGNVIVFKGDWRFDYLEVPLLLRGRVGDVGKATPFFELGPSIGIALAGKFTSEPAFIGPVDLKDNMKALDFGWAAGAGVEFPAGPGRVGVEARYTRGFSDLFNLEDNASTINQAWTFALSYTR